MSQFYEKDQFYLFSIKCIVKNDFEEEIKKAFSIVFIVGQTLFLIINNSSRLIKALLVIFLTVIFVFGYLMEINRFKLLYHPSKLTLERRILLTYFLVVGISQRNSPQGFKEVIVIHFICLKALNWLNSLQNIFLSE